MSIKNILIPFDFTEASISALEYTMNFVGPTRNINIEALYVSAIPTSVSQVDTLNQDFSKVIASLNKKVMHSPILKAISGDVVDGILEYQRQVDADLIFMGTMGDKITDEAITNTSKLVLEANCPVISIPFGCPIKEPKDIALVLGGEEIDDKKVLRTLLDVARTFDSRVHALTIYKESIYAEETVTESNENTLEYYLEHFYEEHAFSKNQDVEEGILDYINKKNIDLLAILPRNHTNMSSPSEGRLTKLLTLHSDIPVLTLD